MGIGHGQQGPIQWSAIMDANDRYGYTPGGARRVEPDIIGWVVYFLIGLGMGLALGVELGILQVA